MRNRKIAYLLRNPQKCMMIKEVALFRKCFRRPMWPSISMLIKRKWMLRKAYRKEFQRWWVYKKATMNHIVITGMEVVRLRVKQIHDTRLITKAPRSWAWRFQRNWLIQSMTIRSRRIMITEGSSFWRCKWNQMNRCLIEIGAGTIFQRIRNLKRTQCLWI